MKTNHKAYRDDYRCIDHLPPHIESGFVIKYDEFCKKYPDLN